MTVCFLHSDFLGQIPWNLFDLLDRLIDSEPPQGYKFITFDDTKILAHLVQMAGVFKSVGEAKRNGWDKPIPPGFSTCLVGKRKTEITIVNKFEGMYDHACRYETCRCGTLKGGPASWAPWTKPKQHAITLCPFDPTSWEQNVSD